MAVSHLKLRATDTSLLRGMKMDSRRAFIETAGTLWNAFDELARYRIVGNTISIITLSVHVQDKDLYTAPDTPAVSEIRSINPAEFRAFGRLFNESSIIIAYSWLDTFLSELEEALFLHDPASLGESVQIKLGKILLAGSVEDLVHDIAKRRTREKSQWGIKNRIAELRERYGISINFSADDLEWMSDLRNNLIHNRRLGEFKTTKGQVRYEAVERRQIQDSEQARKFLSLTFALLVELYLGGATAMGVSFRFPGHRKNLRIIGSIRGAFGSPSP